ncbi:Uncharacterised protein [Moraxella ovis]|nr:Uncharacterised protein [Moraxella ovis]STZ05991.1 Uncharacterised protein [Moraxella ovis]
MKQFKSSIHLSEQAALLVQEIATKIAKLGDFQAAEQSNEHKRPPISCLALILMKFKS